MVRMSVSAPDAEASTLAEANWLEPSVAFSNDEDPAATVIKLCGRNDTALLMQLTAVFISNDLAVSSANINTDAQGVVCDIFRVTASSGGKVWPA
jgi:UTP:GlnB (protein PII) uridylyltransferase